MDKSQCEKEVEKTLKLIAEIFKLPPEKGVQELHKIRDACKTAFNPCSKELKDHIFRILDKLTEETEKALTESNKASREVQREVDKTLHKIQKEFAEVIKQFQES